MANWNSSWQMNVGINHTPAYQVSGRPFASGGIDAQNAEKVIFPYVTRWVVINNHSTTGGATLKVGYSESGVSGSNYFTVPSGSSTGRLEVKVSELWLYGDGCNGVDIAAGLTSIDNYRTSGSLGPSWSGSTGVG